jgi:hypothetical protein
LTPGNTISGYEFSKFIKVITSGQSAVGDFARLRQAFETIYWGAGQTVSLSFWAKADTGTPQIGASWTQNFGGGGSASVNTKFGTVTLSTSWTRYTITGTMPSITGKTIGTSPYNTLQFWFSAGTSADTISLGIGIQNNTFSVTGFQLEIASTASAFQTATGTIQGELAACQRYYFRNSGASTNNIILGFTGSAASATTAQYVFQPPVTMRVAPTAIEFANIQAVDNAAGYALSALAINATSQPNAIQFQATATGMTTYRPLYINASAASAYLGFSAEL